MRMLLEILATVVVLAILAIVMVVVSAVITILTGFGDRPWTVLVYIGAWLGLGVVWWRWRRKQMRDEAERKRREQDETFEGRVSRWKAKQDASSEAPQAIRDEWDNRKTAWGLLAIGALVLGFLGVAVTTTGGGDEEIDGPRSKAETAPEVTAEVPSRSPATAGTLPLRPAKTRDAWEVVPEPSGGQWTFTSGTAQSPRAGFGTGEGSAQLVVRCMHPGGMETSVHTIGRPSYGKDVSKARMLVYWKTEGQSEHPVYGTTYWHEFRSKNKRVLEGLKQEHAVWVSLPNMDDDEERVAAFPLAGSGSAIRQVEEHCRRMRAEVKTRAQAKPAPSRSVSVPATSCPDNDEHGAWAYVQLFVKQELRSPRSADFPWGGARRMTATGACSWSVTSFVDAQNAFGAEIRQHFSARITRLVGGWRLDSLTWH